MIYIYIIVSNIPNSITMPVSCASTEQGSSMEVDDGSGSIVVLAMGNNSDGQLGCGVFWLPNSYPVATRLPPGNIWKAASFCFSRIYGNEVRSQTLGVLH